MAIRRLARRLIFSLALLTDGYAAEPPAAVVIGTPPQPAWHQLDSRQKAILAPLSKDWDAMENIRKKKWLGIAARYPGMKDDEQLRMQERMRDWATLSPEQRIRARDGFKDFKQLPPEQKQVVKQKWEAYTSLSPEDRQRARESGKSSKLLIPEPAGTPPPTAANNDTNKPQ